MANEVTINIESSLAAMAFVVADQQQNIKDLHECIKTVQNTANTWESACNEKQQEIDDLQKRFDELKEQKEQTEQRAQEADNTNEDLKKQLDDEAEQHRLAVASLEATTLPHINWTPWNGEKVQIPVSDILSLGIKNPSVLYLYRVEQEGSMNTITNEPMPAGDLFMMPSVPGVVGDNMIIENFWGIGTTALAYAIIDHRNLLAAADDSLIGKA